MTQMTLIQLHQHPLSRRLACRSCRTHARTACLPSQMPCLVLTSSEAAGPSPGQYVGLCLYMHMHASLSPAVLTLWLCVCHT